MLIANFIGPKPLTYGRVWWITTSAIGLVAAAFEYYFNAVPAARAVMAADHAIAISTMTLLTHMLLIPYMMRMGWIERSHYNASLYFILYASISAILLLTFASLQILLPQIEMFAYPWQLLKTLRVLGFFYALALPIMYWILSEYGGRI